VRGHVTDVADGVVTLATAGGLAVRGRAAGSLAAGEAATLSVRPEAVRLRAGGPETAGPDEVAGTIAEVVYLGSRVRIEGRAADGTLLWADLRDDESSGLERGMAIVVGWPADAAGVWAGHETVEG